MFGRFTNIINDPSISMMMDLLEDADPRLIERLYEKINLISPPDGSTAAETAVQYTEEQGWTALHRSALQDKPDQLEKVIQALEDKAGPYAKKFTHNTQQLPLEIVYENPYYATHSKDFYQLLAPLTLDEKVLPSNEKLDPSTIKKKYPELSTESVLYKNLYNAYQSINKVRSIITVSPNHPDFEKTPGPQKKQYLIRLKEARTQYQQKNEKATTFSEQTACIAKAVTAIGIATCGEISAIGLLEHRNLDPEVKLEAVSFSNNDHEFYVIGRAEGSDIHDYRTWGEHCVICDPLMGLALPLSHIHEMKCYLHFSGHNTILPFDPAFHRFSLIGTLPARGALEEKISKKITSQSKPAETPISSAQVFSFIKEIKATLKEEDKLSAIKDKKEQPPKKELTLEQKKQSRKPIWQKNKSTTEEKKQMVRDQSGPTLVESWMMDWDKMLPQALEHDKQTDLTSGPFPFLTETRRLETLLKKMLDHKTSVNFFHHARRGELWGEWQDVSADGQPQYVNITKALESGHLSQINLTREEIDAYIDYLKITDKESLQKNHLALEETKEKTPLQLGEKMAIYQFTGTAYKEMNLFLKGKGRRDLTCWNNLNEITFQEKAKSLLFKCLMVTHGLKRLGGFDPNFHYVTMPPQLEKILPNHFYIKPSRRPNILFSYFYKNNKGLPCEENVTQDDIKKNVLSDGLFAEEQIKKLLRVIDGQSDLLEDEHLQTFLKDLLQTHQKTDSPLIRFEKTSKNIFSKFKHRIDAHQLGHSFTEDGLMSSIRLTDFNKPGNQKKFAQLINNNNIYLMIYTERNRHTIRFCSEVPDEEEVLFPPDAQFICLNHKVDKQGKHYFILKEVGGLSASRRKSHKAS